MGIVWGLIVGMMALGTASASVLDIDIADWNRIIGHRGMGAHNMNEPENSIPSLVSALVQGASGVEFDVQLTKDGEAVLAHDPKLERMTSGQGCLADATVADLAKLNLRDGAGRITSHRMPTLRETLLALRSYDNGRRRFLADIHIKVYDGVRGDWGGAGNLCPRTKYAELSKRVVETVKELGLIDRVIFTAFDYRVLDRVRKLDPMARVGYLAFYFTSESLRLAISRRYDAVAFNFEYMSPQEVKYAHAQGLLVFAWSPQHREDMEKLFKFYQVDAVITDHLANALQACENSCYNIRHE